MREEMRQPLRTSKGRKRGNAAGLRTCFVVVALSISAALAAAARAENITNEVQLLREQNALPQQQLQKAKQHPANGAVQADFTLTIKNLPTY